MGALMIVKMHPTVKVLLQCLNRTVHLFAERDLIELLFDRAVEPLTNPVGLWAASFCARVVDVLQRQIQLVFMMLQPTTILRPAVG